MTRNGDLENIDSFKVTIGDNLKTVGDIDKSSMREQKNERYRQDTKFRRHLTCWVMVIVPAWLVAVVVVLFFCGLSLCELSDVVLSTLLATTTANILGMAYIVLKGMFPLHAVRDGGWTRDKNRGPD